MRLQVSGNKAVSAYFNRLKVRGEIFSKHIKSLIALTLVLYILKYYSSYQSALFTAVELLHLYIILF